MRDLTKFVESIFTQQTQEVLTVEQQKFVDRLARFRDTYEADYTVTDGELTAWLVWFNPAQDANVILTVCMDGYYELALDIGLGELVTDGFGSLTDALVIFLSYVEKEDNAYEEKRLQRNLKFGYTDADFKAWLNTQL